MLAQSPVTEEELARFYKYVERLPNGCHFWNGARSKGKGNRKWYGSFSYRGQAIRAHVFANDIIAGRGRPPPGHHRDHRCKFSLCVRLDHIEVVTKEVNLARRWECLEVEPEMHFDV